MLTYLNIILFAALSINVKSKITNFQFYTICSRLIVLYEKIELFSTLILMYKMFVIHDKNEPSVAAMLGLEDHV